MTYDKMTMRILPALLLLAVGACPALSTFCWAQNSTPDQTSSSTQQPTKEPAKQPLNAGISTVELELGDIHDILLDMKRAKVATSHLYDEVTRHPITTYNYANVVGPVMMTIPEPMFDMSEVLPARKKYVDLYMQELAPLINYVNTDLAAVKSGSSQLKFSEKAEDKFSKYMNETSAGVDVVSQCTTQLQQLTAAPPYDNLAIAKCSAALNKELRKLEKSTKDLGHELKESGKR
jgi:hypothetical protein